MQLQPHPPMNSDVTGTSATLPVEKPKEGGDWDRGRGVNVLHILIPLNNGHASNAEKWDTKNRLAQIGVTP